MSDKVLKKNKYIIDSIYRYPNRDVNEFSNMLESKLCEILFIPYVIAADVNIDLSIRPATIVIKMVSTAYLSLIVAFLLKLN